MSGIFYGTKSGLFCRQGAAADRLWKRNQPKQIQFKQNQTKAAQSVSQSVSQSVAQPNSELTRIVTPPHCPPEYLSTMAPSTSSSIGSVGNDRREPLTDQTEATSNKSTPSLNDRLNTDHIDIDATDQTIFARIVRTISSFVASLCTPRSMLVTLRVLKAVTLSFLVLTFIADLMYIFFVEVLASSAVSAKVGGARDTIIRLYGLILCIVAFVIELGIGSWIQHFPGLKGFVPRSFLLFLIATITSAHPLHEDHRGKNNNVYDDDNDDDTMTYDEQVSNEIPSSTVVFQMATSLIM